MNPPNLSQAMTQVVAQIADAASRRGVTPPEREKCRRAAQELDNACAALPSKWRPSVRYHQARFLAIAGDPDPAVRLLDDLLTEMALPEALLLKMQLTANGDDAEVGQRRWRIEEQLGTMLPLSSWGRLRDAALERREAERINALEADSPRPARPRPGRDDLIRIASLYASMDLTGDAAHAYREALYAGFSPPGFPVAGEDTWLCPAAAELWLEAARGEALTGRPAWAVQAALLAVACSSKQSGSAGALLDQIEKGERTAPKPMPNEQVFFEIAELYAHGWVHPRAVAALDQAATLIKTDITQRRQMLTEQWRDWLNDYAANRRKTAFLFGHQISKANDSLAITPARFPY